MKKSFILLILFIIIISSCNTISKDSVVCNRPYIRHGDSCCLDQDWNMICDLDEPIPKKEQKVQQPEIKEIEPNKPKFSYIKLEYTDSNIGAKMNLKCNTKEDCIKGMGLSSYSDQEMSQAENSMPGFSKYLDSIQCNEGLCHYKMSENQEPYFDVNNNGAVISCNTKSNCDVGNGMTQLYECVNGICKMHYNNMPIEAWRSVSQNTNLDANQMLPEKCSSNNPSINCIDSAKVNQNSIEIALRNNVGFSIKVDDIWANNCNGNKLMGIGSNTNYQSLGLTVSNNDIFRLLILGCDNTEEMYEGDMIIYYTNTETGLSHQANTEIRSYLN